MSSNFSDIVEPSYLSMMPQYHCDFCENEEQDKSYEFEITMSRLGFIYCSKCVDKARRSAINWYNSKRIIPFDFLRQNKSYQNDFLKFYRKSQKNIQTLAKISPYSATATYDDKYNTFRTVISFGPGAQEPYIAGQEVSSRLVSLENIMHHNPYVYEEIKKAKSLIDSDMFVVTYDDLSDEIEKNLEATFTKSKVEWNSFEN
jgi:hypothetical protein